jgi:hypothetical protein
MKRAKFSDEWIIRVLREHEADAKNEGPIASIGFTSAIAWTAPPSGSRKRRGVKCERALYPCRSWSAYRSVCNEDGSSGPYGSQVIPYGLDRLEAAVFERRTLRWKRQRRSPLLFSYQIFPAAGFRLQV